MNKTTLTIFANFRINDKERFLRMKDSFLSFKDMNPEKWVINIRGKYKDEVKTFLKSHLSQNLCVSQKESSRGWFDDSRSLADKIDTDYVFFWIEDHLNLAPVETLENSIKEMQKTESDVLCYTFFHKGQLNKFANLKSENMDYISCYDMDKKAVELIEKDIGKFYLISVASIFKTSFFKKILFSTHPFFKRWPKETPFDFEKRHNDSKFLPFKQAVPRSELFACIDDDHGQENYSLISRGLYQKRCERSDTRDEDALPDRSFFRSYIPSFLIKPAEEVYRYLRVLQYTFNYLFR